MAFAAISFGPLRSDSSTIHGWFVATKHKSALCKGRHIVSLALWVVVGGCDANRMTAICFQ